ncbi:FxsC protein, partial [Actinoplanes nipponensis]
AYFLSEPCGREWAIFAERARRHRRHVGTSGSGLIPLRWLPPRTMPTAVQVVQYVQEPQRQNPPHESGRERGIRQLLRIQRNRDDYLEFVTTVAELVMDAATNNPLPAAADRVQFEMVPSAFHDQVSLNGSRTPAIEPSELLPRSDKVYFVMSAPTAAQAATPEVGRRDPRFYGESARAWSPYRPALDQPLADYATRIAGARSLDAQITEVGELDQCIDKAERDNQIVVLLVDPWSTRLARNHDILHRYDEREDHPAAVMIPWNRDDAETQAKASELTSAVNRTFPRNVRRPHNTTFRQSVLTHETFGSDLHVVLEESRNRAIANGRIRRPLPGTSGSRPILEGP